jgi:hypothetical protein
LPGILEIEPETRLKPRAAIAFSLAEVKRKPNDLTRLIEKVPGVFISF